MTSTDAQFAEHNSPDPILPHLESVDDPRDKCPHLISLPWNLTVCKINRDDPSLSQVGFVNPKPGRLNI